MSNADEARVRANEQFIDDKIARNARGEFTPWDIVCDMEEQIYDIRDFAAALLLMAEGLDKSASGAIGRVARSIGETAEAIQVQRESLFHSLHPNRDD